MNKVKWLQVNIPIDRQKFSDALLLFPYREDGISGFRISRSSKNQIDGLHIFREEHSGTTITPEGAAVPYSVTEYQVTKFSINFRKKIIRISDYPRSIKRFSNDLFKICGIGFFLKEIDVDIISWIDIIGAGFDSAEFLSIEACNIGFGLDVSGKIKLVGINDVRKSFLKFIGSRPYKIGSAEVVFMGRNNRKKVYFGTRAAMRFGDEVDDTFIDEVESGLLALIELA